MGQPENFAHLEAWTTEHLAVGQDGLALHFFLCRYANGQESFCATRPQLMAHVRNCSSERFASLVKRCAAHGLITVKRLGNQRTTRYEIVRFPVGWTPSALAAAEKFSIPQATTDAQRRRRAERVR
jgi:hypothetical protein